MTETIEMIKAIANDSKVRIDRIVVNYEQLEKENAELKAFKEKCKFNVNDIFKEIETEKQLTKAKEIIRAYKNICNNAPFLDEKEMELKEQTEQFLSEVEK